MNVRIHVHPRIHMGLLDLAGVTPRTYGGLGFFLEDPKTMIQVSRANESSLSADQLGNRDREDLVAAIARWDEEVQEAPIEVDLIESPPQHVGLGSKTGMILGIYAAARSCWNITIPDEDLQRMSGRGGVSGIGINGFFSGGFVVDGGQPQSAISRYSPSSFSSPTEIPPVIFSCEMPGDWVISLYLPEGERYHGGSEIEIFKRHTPLPKNEVLEAISIAYHGIVPAIQLGDLKSLSSSLEKFHETGFKQRELDEQPEEVRRILDSLQKERGVAVGMSSMGPLLYAIRNEHESHKAHPELERTLFVRTSGYNEGAEIYEE